MAILRGTHFSNPEEILSAAVAYGYLDRADFRQRHSRAVGELYSEMIAYVMNWEKSPSIVALLSENCDIIGCIHVPSK